MPNWKEMVTLNPKLGRNGSSERQNKKGWWFWTLKLEMSNGFECRNEWCNGSRCRNENVHWLWELNWNYDGPGCRNENAALNAELRMYNGFTRQMKNGSKHRTKDKQRLWMPNEEGDGFDIEMKMRLWTPKSETWLWTPNGKWIMALNAKWRRWWLWYRNENAAPNVKWKMDNHSECQMKKVMALISKWKCGSERQMENG